MNPPHNKSREKLAGVVGLVLDKGEGLIAAFREHEAALKPEARQEIWFLIERLIETTEELSRLVKDKRSYAKRETTS